MGNEKEPEPGTRGYRINELRKALRMSRDEFADALAAIAANEELDAGGKWTDTRVSKTILGRQPISLDDAAAIILLARARGMNNVTWDYIVFGDVSKAAARDLFKKIAG